MIRKGFTLIEILVVISIIAFLASLAAISLKNTREQSRLRKCRGDLYQIYKQIEIKRLEYSKNLCNITGSAYTQGNCTIGGQVTSASLKTAGCLNRLRQAFTTGGTTARGPFPGLGFADILYDPWGDPYFFDENEGECAWGACRNDYVRSINCAKQGELDPNKVEYKIPLFMNACNYKCTQTQDPVCASN